MKLPKIEFCSESLEERDKPIINPRGDIERWEVVSCQEALIHYPDREFPEYCYLEIGDGRRPWVPGSYTFTHRDLVPGHYNGFELPSPVLQPMEPLDIEPPQIVVTKSPVRVREVRVAARDGNPERAFEVQEEDVYQVIPGKKYPRRVVLSLGRDSIAHSPGTYTLSPLDIYPGPRQVGLRVVKFPALQLYRQVTVKG